MNADDTESRLRSALQSAAQRIQGFPPPVSTVHAAAKAAPRRSLLAPRMLLPVLAVITVAVLAGAIVASSPRDVPRSGQQRSVALGHSLTNSTPTVAPSAASPTGVSSVTGPGKPTTTHISAPGTEPVPACKSYQVDVSYRAGGQVAGNDLGSLDIVNTSAQDCELDGKITVHALDSSGATILAPPKWRNGIVLDHVLLTARGVAGSTGSNAPAGQRWFQVIVGGSLHNATGSQQCPPRSLVTPALWQLVGVVARIVPNLDTTNKAQNSRAQVSACSVGGDTVLLNVGGNVLP